MNRQVGHYKASFIMRSRDPSTSRIVDLWCFRSAKSKKRYIVEAERFSSHFIGIKFYWKGVVDSRDRYSLLTNDYEPRRIIMSCVYIMLEYYKKDMRSSFGFVAAPDLEGDIDSRVPNKRFRFYRRMMLSVFGSETFAQGYDLGNSVYVLINRAELMRGSVTLRQIENEISRLYEGEYALVLES